MARPFDVKSVLRVDDGRRQQALTCLTRPETVKTYTITVPAGQSKLLVLEDRVVPAINPFQTVYLRLASDVEGVHAWPIDALEPAVGANMRPFGWLFDWTWPSYEHDHGDVSDVTVDHATVGTTQFHDNVFPCFQDYPADKLSPIGNHAVFFEAKAGPAQLVRAYDSRGMCVFDNSSLQSGILQNVRMLHVLLGASGYYDLGVRRDGLGFTVLAYAEDASVMNYPTLAFYSYPYCEGSLDLAFIPTATPAGDTVWSSSDRNLCRRNLVNAVLVGWDENVSPNHGPGAFGLISPPLPGGVLADGLNALWYDKSSAADGINGSACPIEGDTTWRRITMISLAFAALGLGDSNAHIVNVFFSPPAGKWWELRPFAYLTPENLFDPLHRPALGFQNPTGRDATVEVEYGATE